VLPLPKTDPQEAPWPLNAISEDLMEVIAPALGRFLNSKGYQVFYGIVHTIGAFTPRHKRAGDLPAATPKP